MANLERRGVNGFILLFTLKCKYFLTDWCVGTCSPSILQIYWNSPLVLPYGWADRDPFVSILKRGTTSCHLSPDKSVTGQRSTAFWGQGTACWRNPVISPDIQAGWLPWSKAGPPLVEAVDGCSLSQKWTVSGWGKELCSNLAPSCPSQSSKLDSHLVHYGTGGWSPLGQSPKLTFNARRQKEISLLQIPYCLPFFCLVIYSFLIDQHSRQMGLGLVSLPL